MSRASRFSVSTSRLPFARINQAHAEHRQRGRLAERPARLVAGHATRPAYPQRAHLAGRPRAAYTPLTPITRLLQSLERKARTGTADVETILRARKQVTRLTKMISDLLDLSRLREDRLITPVHLDLARFVREAVETFREADPRHQVQIEDEMQVIEVQADESRLHQTLSSLLDHVAHATPAGGTIEVTLQRRDALGVITVRADCPVFGGDVLKATEIVEPPHPRPEPVALGLLLAQSITARLGGTLSLTPSRPHETRAEATFPLCATDP